MSKGKVYTVHNTGLAAGDGWLGEQRQSDSNTEWRDALLDVWYNMAVARVSNLCKRQDEDLSLAVRYRTDTDKFYLAGNS